MFEKIAQGIAEQLGVDAGNIKMESRLVDDLKADSLDIVELIMNLEQEYDIQVEDDSLEKLVTVGDIVTYIEKAKQA